MSWSDAVFHDDWYSSFLPDVWGCFLVLFCFSWRDMKVRLWVIIKKKVLLFDIETYFFIAHFFSSNSPSARSDENGKHCPTASIAGALVPFFLGCSCCFQSHVFWLDRPLLDTEEQPMREVTSWRWWNRHVQGTAVAKLTWLFWFVVQNRNLKRQLQQTWAWFF